MLRKIRITLALVFFLSITMLFLDITGCTRAWLGWMAKIQFLPAVMALNATVLAALVIITLLIGRVYCSVICPLGVMQDIIARLGRIGKKNRNRYFYSRSLPWIRYAMLGLLMVAMAAGIGSIVALLDPYGTYGRIAQNLFAPIYGWANNLLAKVAEGNGSYLFYRTDVWIRDSATFTIAVVTLAAIAILAWRNGRTYCNTICPVGTVLGALSRFSWLRPVIDTSKCNSCGLCARRCKAACINSKEHRIDYTRCVACFDCIDNCHQRAISYRPRPKDKDEKSVPDKTDTSRRNFLTGLGIIATTAAINAKNVKIDGGLAVILDKKAPRRVTPIVPAGAQGLRHLTEHCTGCQLCVAACPNGVLRPSTRLENLMQPESSYERGYCRPECTACSDVCPAGAILPITRAEKSSIQVGHAVWVMENCVPLADGVECGNCARHCPAGAITMVASEPGNDSSPKIPAVNEERCIGCGACENLCPARPFSAIYVEGHERHKTI